MHSLHKYVMFQFRFLLYFKKYKMSYKLSFNFHFILKIHIVNILLKYFII